MQTIVHRGENRGVKDLGWLKSRFSFSFSSYQNPVNKGFGLLHTLNDDVVQPGGGFGIHPHSNMEIISIMLQGKMSHKDTMGYDEVVEKDWVQLMSAGSGLRHQEHNVGTEAVNFLQIWIEPKLQNINPRYQRRYFPQEKRKNRLQTIVSNEEGTEHCWINQNARLSLGYFEAGATTSYQLNPVNKALYLFVISGELAIAGETLHARDAIGCWETAEITLQFPATTEFLLIEVPINH